MKLLRVGYKRALGNKTWCVCASLPRRICQQLSELAISQRSALARTSHFRKPLLVTDVTSERLMRDYRDLLREFGLLVGEKWGVLPLQTHGLFYAKYKR